MLPGTGSLPTLGIAVVLAALTAVLVLAARAVAAPRPRRRWACGQLVEPALAWTSAGFTKPLRLVLEAVLRPEREIDGARPPAASCRRSPTAARVPHLIDERLYRPAARLSLAAAAHARRLQSGSLGTYVAYLVALVLVLLLAARVGVIG